MNILHTQIHNLKPSIKIVNHKCKMHIVLTCLHTFTEFQQEFLLKKAKEALCKQMFCKPEGPKINIILSMHTKSNKFDTWGDVATNGKMPDDTISKQ